MNKIDYNPRKVAGAVRTCKKTLETIPSDIKVYLPYVRNNNILYETKSHDVSDIKGIQKDMEEAVQAIDQIVSGDIRSYVGFPARQFVVAELCFPDSSCVIIKSYRSKVLLSVVVNQLPNQVFCVFYQDSYALYAVEDATGLC